MKKKQPQKAPQKPRSSPLIWLIPLLGIVLGGGFALATVPRYRAPGQADEARLRERAVEYYRSSRLFDYLSLTRMLSPANQQLNTESIELQIKKYHGQFPTFDAATQKNLRAAADGIKAELISATLDGDWALVGGKSEYPVEGQVTELPLDETVWVRSEGDWWVYQMQPCEVQYYGLPPEPIREALLRPAEKFELENLPDTMRDVPKEGDERYDPENVMSEEEAQRLLEENRKRRKQGQTGEGEGEGEGGADSGADNGADNAGGA